MNRVVTKDPTAIAGGFHALSDPIRVEVIDLLRGGERCVCELMDALDTAQSRLSFHLKVLKDAGFVTDRREGRWVYYTLNTDAMSDLREFLSDVGAKDIMTRTGSQRARSCCD